MASKKNRIEEKARITSQKHDNIQKIASNRNQARFSKENRAHEHDYNGKPQRQQASSSEMIRNAQKKTKHTHEQRNVEKTLGQRRNSSVQRLA